MADAQTKELRGREIMTTIVHSFSPFMRTVVPGRTVDLYGLYRLPGLVELSLEDPYLTLGGLREIVVNKMFWRQHNCQVCCASLAACTHL